MKTLFRITVLDVNDEVPKFARKEIFSGVSTEDKSNEIVERLQVVLVFVLTILCFDQNVSFIDSFDGNIGYLNCKTPRTLNRICILTKT
jgi:hypothetical protein